MSNETLKAEAAGATTATIEFRGEKFVIPTEPDDMSLDFMESVEEGKSVGIVRGALGPNQWRTVKAMDLKVRDLGELADKIAGALGFGDVGESAASSS